MCAKSSNQQNISNVFYSLSELHFSSFWQHFDQPQLHFPLLALAPPSQQLSVFHCLPVQDMALPKSWTVVLWACFVACPAPEEVTPPKGRRDSVGGTPSGSFLRGEALSFGWICPAPARCLETCCHNERKTDFCINRRDQTGG